MTNGIDVRISRARSHLIQDHPFFGGLVMRLIPVARTDVPKLATDAKHLFYNSSWLATVKESVVLMGAAHEGLHCALGHCFRRGSRDPDRWNIACDHVVNLMLKAAGFDVPDWAYCDLKYAGLNAEQVYRMLEAEEQKQADESGPGEPDDDQSEGTEDGGSDGDASDGDGNDEDGSGQSDGSGDGDEQGDGDGSPADADGTEPGDEAGQGEGGSGPGGQALSGAPTKADPRAVGDVLDAAPPHDQAALDEAAEEWAVYTRQAANVARRAGEGRLPGFLEELVETLNTPKVDWRTTLRRFVDPSSTKDYSWAQPNKRYMSMGLYTPGLVTDGVNHVGFLVDSSGSVSSEWLAKSGAEVQGALDDGAIDKVTVVMCDDVVHTAKEFVKGEQIDFTVKGRGGTRFSPAFDWLDRNAPDVTVAIYLTDLDCSDFGPQPAYPVLWAVYGYDPRNVKRNMEQVPFGECMALED